MVLKVFSSREAAADRGSRAAAATARERSARLAARLDAARHAMPSPTRARARSPSASRPCVPPDQGSHARDRSRKSRVEDAPALRAWTFLVAGSASERVDGATRREVSLRISRSRRSHARCRPRASRGARTANATVARLTRHGTSRARSRRGSSARAGTHSRRPRPSWRETCKPF